MLPPRSIAARAPAFDREALRAALARGGPWPRTGPELAAEVCAAAGRPTGGWVPRAEDGLLTALQRALTERNLGSVVAAPAYGVAGFAGQLDRFDRVVWMDPAAGRVDPGPVEVAQALRAGATAVLLAPIAGDASMLAEVARQCANAGALLAVDTRAAHGSRALDAGPEQFGDVCLMGVSLEPVASPCPGAILSGSGSEAVVDGAGPAPRALAWAARSVLRSVRDEPRLRRLWRPPPSASTPPPALLTPPRWSVAAAAARLRQAPFRAEQRARHARALRMHCSNLPAVEAVPDPRGFQLAGGAIPLLAQQRDAVVTELQTMGVEAITGAAAWLAPPDTRSERAAHVAERLLLLPLHPFYRPPDLAKLAEALRKATLRANGDGWCDPTDTTSQGPADEDVTL